MADVEEYMLGWIASNAAVRLDEMEEYDGEYPQDLIDRIIDEEADKLSEWVKKASYLYRDLIKDEIQNCFRHW